METFPDISPDNTFTPSQSFKTLVSNFENGSEQRRVKVGTKLESFSFSFSTLTAAEKNLILEFHEARRGRYEAFYFNVPLDDGTSKLYTVRFDADVLPTQRQEYNFYSMDIPLVEVRG